MPVASTGREEVGATWEVARDESRLPHTDGVTVRAGEDQLIGIEAVVGCGRPATAAEPERFAMAAFSR